MQDIQLVQVAIDAPWLNQDALDVALRNACGAAYLGMNFQVKADHSTLAGGLAYFASGTAQNVMDQAQVIANAHDPVFLSADKPTIASDGIEAVTITARAPKNGNAAAVVLLVSVNGTVPQELPITLTGGVGSDFITALDPCTITVTLKNPANRATDQLTIKAV